MQKKKNLINFIRELISHTSNKQNEIRATYTVPLKALNNILLGRSISFMTISPQDRFIELSKLKSYYQVNEMVSECSNTRIKEKEKKRNFF